MKKITTHLWFDNQAKEAANFYISVFKDGRIKSSTELHDTPSGDVDMLTIEVLDHEFSLISAGPLFKFTPAVSFTVLCKTTEEVDEFWGKLSEGGKVMMELGEYPFSKRYGWTADKYGVSWQIMFAGDNEIKQRITPSLLFVGDVCGKAEEAINLYTSVFHDSKIGNVMRYQGQAPDKDGTIAHASFTLEGQEFSAMDSAHKHEFSFNEAISFLVHCETQEEIDYYWDKLSADPKSEQCGWLKDKFGLSWQIVPTLMEKMFMEGDKEKMMRVTKAFLQMKKFDLKKLQDAYDGK